MKNENENENKKEQTVTIEVPKEKPSCYKYDELRCALESHEEASKSLKYLYDNYLHHHIRG